MRNKAVEYVTMHRITLANDQLDAQFFNTFIIIIYMVIIVIINIEDLIATKRYKRVDIFEKYSYTKFNENPSSWNRFFHADRERERRDEAKSGFSQFRELS
jgi:hypothetical protein